MNIDNIITSNNDNCEHLQEYFDKNIPIHYARRQILHISSNKKHYDKYFGTGLPWLIIIHYTSCGTMEAIYKLSNYEMHSRVSIHHIVDYKTVFNLVDYQVPAWHAGNSFWKGRDNINRHAIGIEVVNNGSVPFNDEQIITLKCLVQYYQEKLSIPDWCVIGHSDIACGRKADPGVHFPWNRILHNPSLVSLDIDGTSCHHAVPIDTLHDNMEYLHQVGYNPEYDMQYTLDAYYLRYARYINNA